MSRSLDLPADICDAKTSIDKALERFRSGESDDERVETAVKELPDVYYVHYIHSKFLYDVYTKSKLSGAAEPADTTALQSKLISSGSAALTAVRSRGGDKSMVASFWAIHVHSEHLEELHAGMGHRQRYDFYAELQRLASIWTKFGEAFNPWEECTDVEDRKVCKRRFNLGSEDVTEFRASFIKAANAFYTKLISRPHLDIDTQLTEQIKSNTGKGEELSIALDAAKASVIAQQSTEDEAALVAGRGTASKTSKSSKKDGAVVSNGRKEVKPPAPIAMPELVIFVKEQADTLLKEYRRSQRSAKGLKAKKSLEELATLNSEVYYPQLTLSRMLYADAEAFLAEAQTASGEAKEKAHVDVMSTFRQVLLTAEKAVLAPVGGDLSLMAAAWYLMTSKEVHSKVQKQAPGRWSYEEHVKKAVTSIKRLAVTNVFDIWVECTDPRMFDGFRKHFDLNKNELTKMDKFVEVHVTLMRLARQVLGTLAPADPKQELAFCPEPSRDIKPEEPMKITLGGKRAKGGPQDAGAPARSKVKAKGKSSVDASDESDLQRPYPLVPADVDMYLASKVNVKSGTPDVSGLVSLLSVSIGDFSAYVSERQTSLREDAATLRKKEGNARMALRCDSEATFTHSASVHGRASVPVCQQCGIAFSTGAEFHNHMITTTDDGHLGPPVCVSDDGGIDVDYGDFDGRGNRLKMLRTAYCLLQIRPPRAEQEPAEGAGTQAGFAGDHRDWLDGLWSALNRAVDCTDPMADLIEIESAVTPRWKAALKWWQVKGEHHADQHGIRQQVSTILTKAQFSANHVAGALVLHRLDRAHDDIASVVRGMNEVVNLWFSKSSDPLHWTPCVSDEMVLFSEAEISSAAEAAANTPTLMPSYDIIRTDGHDVRTWTTSDLTKVLSADAVNAALLLKQWEEALHMAEAPPAPSSRLVLALDICAAFHALYSDFLLAPGYLRNVMLNLIATNITPADELYVPPASLAKVLCIASIDGLQELWRELQRIYQNCLFPGAACGFVVQEGDRLIPGPRLLLELLKPTLLSEDPVTDSIELEPRYPGKGLVHSWLLRASNVLDGGNASLSKNLRRHWDKLMPNTIGSRASAHELADKIVETRQKLERVDARIKELLATAHNAVRVLVQSSPDPVALSSFAFYDLKSIYKEIVKTLKDAANKFKETEKLELKRITSAEEDDQQGRDFNEKNSQQHVLLLRRLDRNIQILESKRESFVADLESCKAGDAAAAATYVSIMRRLVDEKPWREMVDLVRDDCANRLWTFIKSHTTDIQDCVAALNVNARIFLDPIRQILMAGCLRKRLGSYVSEHVKAAQAAAEAALLQEEDASKAAPKGGKAAKTKDAAAAAAAKAAKAKAAKAWKEKQEKKEEELEHETRKAERQAASLKEAEEKSAADKAARHEKEAQESRAKLEAKKEAEALREVQAAAAAAGPVRPPMGPQPTGDAKTAAKAKDGRGRKGKGELGDVGGGAPATDLGPGVGPPRPVVPSTNASELLDEATGGVRDDALPAFEAWLVRHRMEASTLLADLGRARGSLEAAVATRALEDTWGISARGPLKRLHARMFAAAGTQVVADIAMGQALGAVASAYLTAARRRLAETPAWAVPPGLAPVAGVVVEPWSGGDAPRGWTDAGDGENNLSGLLDLLGVADQAADPGGKGRPLAPLASRGPLPSQAAAQPGRRGGPPARPPAPPMDDENDADLQRALSESLLPTAAPVTTARPAWPATIEGGSGGAGLANAVGEYNCFLNVVIQALWHLRPFRSAVAALPARGVHTCIGEPCVACELLATFAALAAASGDGVGSGACVAPGGLRIALAALSAAKRGPAGGLFALGTMNDASEVLAEIYDALHRAHAPAAPGPTGAASTGFECTAGDDGRGCVAHRAFGLDMAEKVACPACGVDTHALAYCKYFHLAPAAALRAAAAAHPGAGLAAHLLAVDEADRTPCDSDFGGCGAPAPTVHTLTRAPQAFTLVLSWESARVAREDIAATVAGLDDHLPLGQLYAAPAGQVAAPTYDLRCVVCYYGQHYHAFVRCPPPDGGPPVWWLFDDITVRRVGDWETVRARFRDGHLQPSVLFYERSGPADDGGDVAIAEGGDAGILWGPPGDRPVDDVVDEAHLSELMAAMLHEAPAPPGPSIPLLPFMLPPAPLPPLPMAGGGGHYGLGPPPAIPAGSLVTRPPPPPASSYVSAPGRDVEYAHPPYATGTYESLYAEGGYMDDRPQGAQYWQQPQQQQHQQQQQQQQYHQQMPPPGGGNVSWPPYAYDQHQNEQGNRPHPYSQSEQPDFYHQRRQQQQQQLESQDTQAVHAPPPPQQTFSGYLPPSPHLAQSPLVGSGEVGSGGGYRDQGRNRRDRDRFWSGGPDQQRRGIGGGQQQQSQQQQQQQRRPTQQRGAGGSNAAPQ